MLGVAREKDSFDVCFTSQAPVLWATFLSSTGALFFVFWVDYFCLGIV